jgi:hypothetical protein
MPFARDDHELVREERLQRQHGMVFALRPRTDTEIERAVSHERCEVLRESFDDSQLDARVLNAETCDGLRHDERAHGGAGAEADRSFSG